jgi:hypothetical protein
MRQWRNRTHHHQKKENIRNLPPSHMAISALNQLQDFNFTKSKIFSASHVLTKNLLILGPPNPPDNPKPIRLPSITINIIAT